MGSTHKKYSSYCTKQKKSHVFFLRILTYQSTLNICTIQSKNHPLPLPILLNTIIIKTDPHGKKIAMLIPRSDGFSNVGAQGHHLRMQLWSQKQGLCNPNGKKYATIHQKNRPQWYGFCHPDQKCPWRGWTLSPQAKQLPSPSQYTSQHALQLLHCLRGVHGSAKQSHSIVKISIILHQLYTRIMATIAAPSHTPSTTRIKTTKVNGAKNTPASLWMFQSTSPLPSPS